MMQKTHDFSALQTQRPADRPPVVAVLGHVDHGKTTLLDTIRKSAVAQAEHGGITQHIGAYQIEVEKSKEKSAKGRFITFIDTPGHEAFSAMRSRGASVADIVLLVVAADDSVKPQTLESIKQIKSAGVSMIVVINKIDMPGANVDKVKSDLAKAGVQVEGFGGDIPAIAVSAKQGKGIAELLDLILLVSDMKGLSADTQRPVEAVVIETKRDKRRGITATLLVKRGILSQSADLFEGPKVVGRARALFDENGNTMTDALPGKPVEVLGFSKLPSVGAIIATQAIASAPKASEELAPQVSAVDFLAAMDEAAKKRLVLILKADTAGSLEAIVSSLPTDQVSYVRQELGDITEGDILDAKAAKALVIGFNVKIPPAVAKLARIEKIIVRTYTVIYELLDELRDVLEGLEEVLAPERELGHGQIVAQFPFEGARVAGTKVLMGRLARGDSVKIIRKDEEIGRARIQSMRRGKEDVTKTEAGNDCGILLDKKVDFDLGDAIIATTT